MLPLQVPSAWILSLNNPEKGMDHRFELAIYFVLKSACLKHNRPYGWIWISIQTGFYPCRLRWSFRGLIQGGLSSLEIGRKQFFQWILRPGQRRKWKTNGVPWRKMRAWLVGVSCPRYSFGTLNGLPKRLKVCGRLFWDHLSSKCLWIRKMTSLVPKLYDNGNLPCGSGSFFCFRMIPERVIERFRISNRSVGVANPWIRPMAINSISDGWSQGQYGSDAGTLCRDCRHWSFGLWDN